VSLRVVAGACALTAALPGWGARAADEPRRVPVARLEYVEGQVELAAGRDRWQRAAEGERLSTGDRLRSGDSGLVRVEFPWMRLLVSPGSELALPAGVVLSLVLETGRVEIHSEGDSIKLVSAGAEVRGAGHAVVRRAGAVTTVAVLDGRFQVEAGNEITELEAGTGAVLGDGRKPAPEPLPAPPGRVTPGADPQYVRQGRPARLAWQPSGGRHHLQLLAIDRDVVLLARDVGAAPAELTLPWPGTFRWRVSSRDARGLEGPPSAEGLVCVIN